METLVFFEPQVFRAAIWAHMVCDIRLWLEQGKTAAVIRDRLQKRLPMALELAEPEQDDRGVPTIRVAVDPYPDPGTDPGEVWREMRARLRAEAAAVRRALAAECAAFGGEPAAGGGYRLPGVSRRAARRRAW